MSSSYSVEFAPSGGLHPSLTIAYSAPHSSCPLYLHLSLPPAFIPDRFQLAQLHTEGRLGSHAFDPAALSLEVTGSRDLEGPSSRAVGAQVLLRLRAGREELVNVKGKGREVVLDTVDLPLHLRYQPPVRKRWNQKGERLDIVPVELAWPTVFWACQEDQSEFSVFSLAMHGVWCRNHPTDASDRPARTDSLPPYFDHPFPFLFAIQYLTLSLSQLYPSFHYITTTFDPPRSHGRDRRPTSHRIDQLCHHLVWDDLDCLGSLQGLQEL